MRENTPRFADAEQGIFLFSSFQVSYTDQKQHRCVGELERQATLEDRERLLSERASTVNAFERRLAERETLLRQTLERETTAML